MMRTDSRVSWNHYVVFVATVIGLLAGCSDAGPSARRPNGIPGVVTTAASFVNDGKPVDWPSWRGTNQNGISPETGWTTDWPEDGPAKLWRTDVGIGFSSVSVVRGRLYTMGHRPHSDADEGEEEEADPSENGDSSDANAGDAEEEVVERGIDTVYCLDAKTGDVVWTHSYSCRLVANLHEGGPAATPTVYDDQVFTVSKEGHFFCLDAETGDVIWERMFVEDLGVKMPGWGFSCSPLVEGELVIVEGGRTAAYNRSTGELVWKTDRFRPGYGSAIGFDFAWTGGRTQRLVSVLNNDCLLMLEKETGKEFARYDWTTSYQTSASTPTVVGKTVFISTGYRRGCLLATIGDGELEKVYENKQMCNHMNNCVLWDGCWYGFNGNSHNRRNVTLNCIDYETGELHWKERGLGCGSLMIAGGRLVCLSDRGDLVIVEPSSDEYQEIARAKVISGKCWTVPVLSGGCVFVRNATGDLVCLDVSRHE